jgi:hypothetical protein
METHTFLFGNGLHGEFMRDGANLWAIRYCNAGLYQAGVP